MQHARVLANNLLKIMPSGRGEMLHILRRMPCGLALVLGAIVIFLLIQTTCFVDQLIHFDLEAYNTIVEARWLSK